jgi:hypothetical protein
MRSFNGSKLLKMCIIQQHECIQTVQKKLPDLNRGFGFDKNRGALPVIRGGHGNENEWVPMGPTGVPLDGNELRSWEWENDSQQK